MEKKGKKGKPAELFLKTNTISVFFLVLTSQFAVVLLFFSFPR